VAGGHHRDLPHLAPKVRAVKPGYQGGGTRPQRNRPAAPIRAHASAAPAARIPRDVHGRTLTL